MTDSSVAKIVEKVLSEYSEEKKAEITSWILKLGVRPDDPLFNLYAELGTTQFALQQLPGRLDSVVVGWTNMVDSQLKSAATVAIQQQKSAIADASKELLKLEINRGGTSKLNLSYSNWGLIAGALGLTLGLGVVVGGLSYKTATESARSVNLPFQDKEALVWAKSPNGKAARAIYTKNAGIIKACQQQQKDLGACIILVD